MVSKKKTEDFIKIPEQTITSCSVCPYCEFDSYYSMGRDSGYDCKEASKRIIDTYEWDNSNNPKRLCRKMKGIPIPDWCPFRITPIKSEKLTKQLGNVHKISGE